MYWSLPFNLHFSFMALGINTPIVAFKEKAMLSSCAFIGRLPHVNIIIRTDRGLNPAAGFLEPCILREHRRNK
jgi:hypothetical protein